MTWTADNRQLTAVCDGTGWNAYPRKLFNSRLFAITGAPQQARFDEVKTYPELLWVEGSQVKQRYYGFGTLAVDGHIYQYLSTPNHTFDDPNARFIGAKLIYSADQGRTWCNQDGTHPVRWEERADRSRENMIFFNEDQDSFSLISLLQMGCNYNDNRDGYVYGYSPNGSIEGAMNQLVMFRTRREHVHLRSEYQFYSGHRFGKARWSSEISERSPILTFPPGWVNKSLHPWAWMPSVTYNPPLGLYLMASWGNGASSNGKWFDKPSYLGLWTSFTPWGPWEQIHEETAWTPNGDKDARAFSPQIAPQWISQDGKSFWIVWADFQTHKSELFEQEIARVHNQLKFRTMTDDDVETIAKSLKEHMPYYSFNTQRVDLTLG